MKATLLVFFLALYCIAASAGPMGLEMGETVEALKQKAELTTTSPHTYKTSKLPGGHPDFTLYTLLITPQHGLCKVSALSETVSTSVYGVELVNSFDKYFSALTKKYGEGKRFDRLKPGSIWNEPKDWMTSLRKKERSLVSFWTSKETSLADNVSAIKLEAHALDSDSGVVSISYEFANASACLEAIRGEKDSAL